MVERDKREIAESLLGDYALEGYPDAFPEIANRLREEAEGGETEAQSRLGELYFFGFGVPRDSVEEAKWRRKAAIGGDGFSQHVLAWLYMEGTGLEQDYRQALDWLRRAADRGREADRMQYACLSPKPRNRREIAATADLEGVGSALSELVELSFTMGILWWSSGCEAKYTRWGLDSFLYAANAGHPKAQYMIGVAYLSGRGLAPDDMRAGRWFLRAARQGHGAAKREYCALHRAGVTAPEIDPPGPEGCRGVPSP